MVTEAPVETPLAPLPPGLTVPATFEELMELWDEGGFLLVLRRGGDWVKADLSLPHVPTRGQVAHGQATFTGPLFPANRWRVERKNGEALHPWQCYDFPRLHKNTTLTVTVTLGSG